MDNVIESQKDLRGSKGSKRIKKQGEFMKQMQLANI